MCKIEDKNILDAALINAAQAFERDEIARYGTLVWVKRFGRNDCAAVLQKPSMRKRQPATS